MYLYVYNLKLHPLDSNILFKQAKFVLNLILGFQINNKQKYLNRLWPY